MSLASLYVKEPATSRFVTGDLAEIYVLFGHPLPLLPPPEREAGRDVHYVRFHPRLKTLMQRFVQGLLGQIGLAGPTPPGQEAAAREQAEYETALARLLRSARSVDRRLGLINLFWLAHSREVATCLREMEARYPPVRKLKYSLHPLLATFYRQIDQSVRREEERDAKEETRPRENMGLVEAVIEDGFAFTEPGISELDFNQFLASNKRYRLTPDLFFEVYTLLVRETERRLREGDRALLSRVSRHLPGLSKEQWSSQAGVVKVMLNPHVLTYLFADVWNTGVKLMASARIQSESERRKPAEVLDAFLDLVSGVKRFEILSHVRDRIVVLDPFGPGRELHERVSQGTRVYEFGDAAQVLNNAVNATVLFLDLRGFTKTSEGHISERDLTRELYVVFDAFVPCIQRFGGTVDKYLGDGMMVTFGTGHTDPLDPLNAVRAAILCQEKLKQLRDEGRTFYQMGISIHHGRVYVARFLIDEDSVQTTVIGRNVNLAGRLSSAAKKSNEDDETVGSTETPPLRPSGLQVTVDVTGTLCNQGIAISRDALTQLEQNLPLNQSEESGKIRLDYFDEAIGRRIIIRYAGDAKFKGVSSSFPVHEVDYEV